MDNRRIFETRIRRFSALRRGVLNAALAYRLTGLALAASALGLVLLAGWLPNALLNMALYLALAMLLVVLAFRYVLRRARFRSLLGEAFVMEGLVQGLNSRIVSALDFVDRKPPTPLTTAVVSRAERDLKLDFETRVDRTQRNLRRKQFVIALVAFLAIGFSPWFGFQRFVSNFERSWVAALDALFPLEYALLPGAGKHIKRLGEPVELELRFKRPGIHEVKLVRKTEEGSTTQDLTVDDQGRVAQTVTSDVETEEIVFFEFGDRRTEEMTLIFTTPPSVVNMQTELMYPSYTKLLPRTLEGVQQRLAGLPGTRITLGFTFSKELESAEITWETGPALPLETVGRFASVSLMHSQARRASLQVRDIHGFALDDPLIIDFEEQNDEPPRLFLPRHLTDKMPLLEEAVPLFGFGVRVQDDFGVTRCALRWQRSTVDNENSVSDQGEVERLISPEQRQAVINFETLFAGMSLKPGDRISFQVEAQDNRNPKKQVTRSRRCSFFVYQDELGGLSIKELGFGGRGALGRERIPKSTRTTQVKAPEGLRTRELVRNEFAADVTTSTRPPTARGEHGQATRDYFRLLSTVSVGDDNEKPKAQEPSNEPPAP